MRTDVEIKYDTLNNLVKGDTFITDGAIYMLISPSCYNSDSKQYYNIVSEDNVAAINLKSGDIKVFNRYTSVYIKDFKIVENI